MAEAGEVHITVATGWVEGRTSLDVAHETTLVKAALLYADRVTLASPRVALLASFASILAVGEVERADVALQMVQVMPEGRDIAARVRSLRRKKHKTVDERYRLLKMEQQLRATGAELAKKVEELLTGAGVAELAAAMGAGVVDLDALGMGEAGAIDNVAHRLGDVLAKVVSPGSTTYPLLDESTNSLVRAMVREGMIPGGPVATTAEPALAASWIGDMEAFPGAPIEAVLDARAALRNPLVRFRAAVLQVSRDLEATPLDEEWQRTAEEAYREHVAPALLELRQLAEEQKVLSLLRHATSADALKKVGAAGLGLFGATTADVPAIVGAAVGVAAEVGSAMVGRYQELADRSRANAFLFLYEADRELARRAPLG